MNLKFVRIDIKFRYWIPIASVVLGGVVSAQIDGYTLLNRIDWTKIDFGKSDQKTDDDWVPWSSDADFPILLNSETEVRLKLLKKTDTEDRKDVELDVDYEDVFRDGIRTSNGDIQLEFLGLKEGPYTVVLLSADGKAKGSAPLGKFEILIDGKTVARELLTRSGEDVGFAISRPIIFSNNGGSSMLTLKRLDGEIWLNGLMLTEGARMEHKSIRGEVLFESLPYQVKDTIEKELSGYVLDDIDRIASGRRVRFMIEGEDDDDLNVELELDENGLLLQRVEDIRVRDLPVLIIESIKAVSPGSEIREASRLTTPRSSVFRVEVEFNDNDVVLILSENGALISRKQ